jgi:hypothetical protein
MHVTTSTNCEFDYRTLTLSCETTKAPDPVSGIPVWSRATTTWGSVGDALVENRPAGKWKHTRASQTWSGTECQLVTSISYDSLGRATSETMSDPSRMRCPTRTTIFEAWDSDGRPTFGRGSETFDNTDLGRPAVSPCTAQTTTYSYDDILHTVNVETAGGTDCVEEKITTTFDADGIVVAWRYDPGMGFLPIRKTNTLISVLGICP